MSRRHPFPDDLERLAALRHFRHGGGFGPDFPFGRPFGGGRGRARRGDVRLATLMLLAEEPRNGYQLMQEIEERSGGRWRPSPGSVYPALSQLEDQGFIRSTERDGAKLLEITDAGREELAQRGEPSPPWDVDDDPATEALFDLRKLIGDVAGAAMQVARVGSEQQRAAAAQTLEETRRGLYRILADDADE
jgi:DNA-binding PadR family transcriptional regulator